MRTTYPANRYHHHSVACLLRSPCPLEKRVLQQVRSSASYFNFQHPLVSLRLFSSCLRLLSRLPVTCIVPPNFTSITCFRRQFPHNLWTIQLSFRPFIICRIFFSSLTPCNTSLLHLSHDRSNWSSPFFFSTTIQRFTDISYLFSECFSWFPCVYKQMLRWFPRFQVATTCFSCSPLDLKILTNFIFCIHVK